MSFPNIFTVSSGELGALSPESAVNLFRELLWAEAAALGIGKHQINVPSAITVTDGGIDAEVEGALVPVGRGQGLIRPGLTRYQIKTGNFSIGERNYVDRILFTPSSLRKGAQRKLQPRVQSCLDRDGTLVVVLFGWDKPEIKDGQIVGVFADALTAIDSRYATAKIEIWRQNQIIGFLRPYPSLALQATGKVAARFQTHRSWSQEDTMRPQLHAGELQAKFIDAVQHPLRTNQKAVHIRVWGEPGIGKTKLVLEATSVDDLAPLVIYCDDVQAFRDSDLMTQLLRDDNKYSVILVLDECDADNRSYLWNKFKHTGPRIKIISIVTEHETTSGDIIYVETPPLDPANTARIIETYGIPRHEANRWAGYCGGSPRVAHVIGRNLQSNPEDLLKPPDTDNVWERYVCGGDNPASTEVHQRRLVLQHTALFTRFGFSGPVTDEARAIARTVQTVDPNVTWPRFVQITQELRARKILQGETTLYVTPKALHIKLWAEWWDNYGRAFDVEQFSSSLPPQLVEWFYEMFRYAQQSRVAVNVVDNLLGPNGLFERHNILGNSDDGARFYLLLTEANPKAALGFLERLVRTWGQNGLEQFTSGRHEVVSALERIAVWRDLFPGAARLLLAFAETEPDTRSWSGGRAFVELFSLGYGPLAPTEAPPQERLPVLIEALDSESKRRRQLALGACEHALNIGNRTRVVGAERQGLRAELVLWVPKTYEELFDAYRQVWDLLRSRVNTLSDDEQQRAVRILLEQARGLARVDTLAPMVLETMRELAQCSFVDRKQILKVVVNIARYERRHLPADTLHRWQELKEELTGHNFTFLLRRYVGMDLVEDHFDEQGNRSDLLETQIHQLAVEASGNPELLEPEWEWLLGGEAPNGFQFGYELGKLDEQRALLPNMLGKLRNMGTRRDGFVLGGYLRALFEAERGQWENELDTIAGDPTLNTLIPELTWRSGLTDRAARRVLTLAKAEIIPVTEFRMFGLGSVLRAVSPDVCVSWIEFLLSRSERIAAPIALQLADFYFVFRQPSRVLPEELMMRLLTHESLFQRPEAGTWDTMSEHYWGELAKRLIHQAPERGLVLASKILEHCADEGTIVDRYSPPVVEVLDHVLQKYPNEVWLEAAQYVGPRLDERAYRIRSWLRGRKTFWGQGEDEPEDEGALMKIPAQYVWAWVEEDAEERAPLLARFVPPELFHDPGKTCWARELLARYGNRDDVRDVLTANFGTEGWSGPASLHYTKKRERLLTFLEAENDRRVIAWVNDSIGSLDREIEQAKISEERTIY